MTTVWKWRKPPESEEDAQLREQARELGNATADAYEMGELTVSAHGHLHIEPDDSFYYGALSLDESRALARSILAAQGLHVVNAAEKAVLDAGNLVLDTSLRRIADENGGCLADWAKAELAARTFQRR